MTQDLSWPKASEGGKVVGREQIRTYWTRQWAEFDPYVEPLAMTEEDGGKTRFCQEANSRILIGAGTGIADHLSNDSVDPDA